jgi:hypothetical protein
MGLSCNPAALADENRSQLRMNLVFDDNFKDTVDSAREVDKKDKAELLDIIFEHRDTLVTNARAGLWYQNDWWAVSLTPVRAGLITKTTNPAYPQVDAIAVKETELLFRGGLYLENDSNFRVGLDARFVNREFVDKKFDLTEATSNPDIIEIQEGRQFYLEPAFIYGFDSAWKSELSVAVTNWAAYSSGTKPEGRTIFDIGLASVPDFIDGKFRSTVHFTTVPGIEDWADRLRWSGIFEFSDMLSSSFTLAGHEQGLGFLGRLDSVVLGAGVKNEKIKTSSGPSEDVHSLIFELGLVF